MWILIDINIIIIIVIKYLNKVSEWKLLCSSNQMANSVQEAETLLKKHHELSDEISQIYAEVFILILILLFLHSFIFLSLFYNSSLCVFLFLFFVFV